MTVSPSVQLAPVKEFQRFFLCVARFGPREVMRYSIFFFLLCTSCRESRRQFLLLRWALHFLCTVCSESNKMDGLRDLDLFSHTYTHTQIVMLNKRVSTPCLM